ncbi:aminotransferase class III-fold pyridoxal phosphate-dependent enzyme [bacterium]|nr:aminotransferase class III-fold pyridoxal phosphate-dependent enzyme [bacterium]
MTGTRSFPRRLIGWIRRRLSRTPAAEPQKIYDWDLSPHLHPMQGTAGRGGRLIDHEGREFIDLNSAWGTNLLGYGYPAVSWAIRRQARQFANLGVPDPNFFTLMNVLREIVPGAEQIRYGKNGSDVTAGAVRLARAVTGREHVIHYGYHGFHDWWMASSDCRGIPRAMRRLIHTLPELTPAAVSGAFRRWPHDIACLILDPMAPPWAEAETIREIVEIVRSHGGLVIFDEMVSGFRVAPGGAQEVWAVTPDLSCFGKSIANGLPLSVLAGSERFMRLLPQARYGMTFEAESVSIAAALATLGELRGKNVCRELARKGRFLREAYAAQAKQHGLNTGFEGQDARPCLRFEDHGRVGARQLRWLLIQELARAGIITQGALTVCYSHTDQDLNAVAAVFGEALRTVASAVERGTTQGLLDERIRVCLQ